MKKTLIFILIVSLMVCLGGCSEADSDLAKPINVYYCRKNIDYQTEMGVFAVKILDFRDWDGRMLAFMNFYLSGQVDENMTSPFPAGASINAIEYRKDSLKIQLNPLFSRLSACELTIACACISLTLFELTSAYSVTFSYYNSTNETIAVMTRDNLIFKDLSVTN